MLKGFSNINTMKDIFEKIYEDAKHNDYIFMSYFQFFDQHGAEYLIGFPSSFLYFSFKTDKCTEKFDLKVIPINASDKEDFDSITYPITNCGINHENGLIITPVLRE